MTSEPENRITVRLKKAGWEVEITCSEEQLKRSIESVLSSLDAKASVTLPGQSTVAESTVDAGKKTSRGIVSELWAERWFSEPRSLSDVDGEIRRRGYNYDKTAVSHTLTDLVRETLLTRQGNPRSYSYIQKRPPQIPGGNQGENKAEQDTIEVQNSRTEDVSQV